MTNGKACSGAGCKQQVADFILPLLGFASGFGEGSTDRLRYSAGELKLPSCYYTDRELFREESALTVCPCAVCVAVSDEGDTWGTEMLPQGLQISVQ